MFKVTPLCLRAAATARKADPSAGGSVEALSASAWALPSGVLGSANSTFERSTASAHALVPAAVNPSPGSMAAPPIRTSLVKNVRREVSPLNQASTSSDKPALKSRSSRSFIIVFPPIETYLSAGGCLRPSDDLCRDRRRHELELFDRARFDQWLGDRCELLVVRRGKVQFEGAVVVVDLVEHDP